MEMISIPKDFCLCDVCNAQLTDRKFKVIQDCTWYEGYLCCTECEFKYKFDKGDLPKVAKYVIGDDISNTRLAKPVTLFGF